MDTEKMHLGIRCEKSIVDALTTYAAANDLTLSQVVRKVLREYAAEVVAATKEVG